MVNWGNWFLKKWFCQIFVYKQEYYQKVTTARRTTDQSKNKSCKDGKSQTAPSLFHYAVTSQGEAQRNPGNRILNNIALWQPPRWRRSAGTGFIVEAMMFPGNHCIGEYVIPYRNAISVNAGLGQCSSDALSPGLRFAHPGLSRRNEIKTELSDSCRPVRACLSVNPSLSGR